MQSFSVPQYTKNKRTVLFEKLSTTLVFGIYSVMVLFALVCVGLYGKNIPLAEDWLVVAPFTGNEPDILNWLWKQNNEHRVPFPKAVMLGLLKLTNGNFKAGMYFSVLLLSGLVMAVLIFLRRLRGGQTKLTDAFFPLLLLHIGHWENMVWSWQVSFVLPSILTFVFFLILIKNPLLDKPGAALTAGILLLLLPWCGGNGLLFVPFLALWFFFCAAYNWRTLNGTKTKRLVSGILIVCASICIVFCGLYFIGYTRVTWNPPSPGIVKSIETAIRFVVMSAGPAVKYFWKIGLVALVAIFGMLAWCIYLVVRAFFNEKGQIEKYRALIIGLFFGIMAVFTMAIGWGRAGLVPQYGMPDRYVLLASPLLFICFFTSEFYEKKKWIQVVLFLMMFSLVPFNTKAGFEWRNWYLGGATSLTADLSQNLSSEQLAKRNKTFLIHWWGDKELAKHIEMLQNLEDSPFYKPANKK